MPDKNDKFTKVTLSTEAIHEVGKKYWSGYWSKWYTVLDAQHDIHGKNAVLKSVTVQWEDGIVNTHATPLDPRKDFELRDMERTMEAQIHNVASVGIIHYAYSDEHIKYKDSKQFLKEYREAIDIYGPNGVSAAALTDDIELGHQILSIEAGEYGLSVDKEKYIQIAQQYGCMAPQRMEAIVDESESYYNDIDSTEKQLLELADTMEIGSRSDDVPPVGKVTLHAVEREIVYTSKEQLQRDYATAVNKFGATAISTTLFVKDHDLSFALDKLEAEELGFGLDKEKYMELIEKYGQNSSELTQATYEHESSNIKVAQEPPSFELEI